MGHLKLLDVQKKKEVGIDWYDKKLTDFWGKENYQSAKDYLQKVKDAEKNTCD